MRSDWWTRAVFYEIYTRSFQDSNGDGVGDLNGITSRLDYLVDLGIDAVWITPFYPSPQVDFGYDVSDYENVDPLFGSLADFDRLVVEAHRRKIRVLVDLVLNHTSDRHPLFESSRASRTSPHRDWYIWRDGRGDGLPPNNWESAFGGSAWSYDEATRQWYYHFFYPEQPDLNWRNPEVEQWMFAAVKFWIDHGVDGFRLDAINTLFEDQELRDNPPLPQPRVKLTGVSTQDLVYTRGLPEVHDVLQRLRRFAESKKPDVLLVSEAYVDTLDDLIRFYGNGDQVQLPFNFFLAQVPALSAAAFRRIVADVERAFRGHWPSLVLSNHDIERACDRFGNGSDGEAVAKLLGAMLLTLRGTPFLYYGEELAMRTHTPQHIDEVRDPVGRTFWPNYRGRDGERTPMQWDATPRAGFTTGTPWLPIPVAARERNVARQTTDPRSVLSFHRALIGLRRTSDALLDGSYRAVGDHPDVFAFVREGATHAMLVVLNMADTPNTIELTGDPVADRSWRIALGTHRPEGGAVGRGPIVLEPYEVLVLRA